MRPLIITLCALAGAYGGWRLMADLPSPGLDITGWLIAPAVCGIMGAKIGFVLTTLRGETPQSKDKR